MDYDLWLKIASRYEVQSVEQTLAAFRIHERSKSGAEAQRFWPEVRRISRRHGGRFFAPVHVNYLARRHPRLFWAWRVAARAACRATGVERAARRHRTAGNDD